MQNSGNQKYCSPECSQKERKQYYKIYRQEHRAEQKAYRQIHKEELNKKCKEYCQIHKEERKEQKKQYNFSHPAKTLLHNINVRIKYQKEYKNIKNKLTLEQIKTLMLYYGYIEMRDKGLKPNIHRRNNNGNYEMDNCCFLPEKLHYKLHNLLRELN